MPSKIPFRVIHVSGQDDGYKAMELNSHSPTTKGWQSSRFCLYPQDIVLQVEKRCRLRKLQILSHQFLIPTKIEFYVGDVPHGMHPNLQNARYTRLGYVALSDNAKTTFKARELKSVHVDAIGCFVKFVIHKNHINKHNIYNQVGLVAINVIGDDITKGNQVNDMEIYDHNYDPVISGIVNKSQSFRASGDRLDRPDYISPLDDLAFDMYQDPEVAGIIRRLEKKKQEAVIQERYDFAKKIKDTLVHLQKVGEKLGKFEVEKRQAVETEDYEKAKLKKTQMEEYRVQMYQQLELEDLLEIAGARHPMPVDLEPSRQSTPPRLTEIPNAPVPIFDDQPLTPYDDRPLPAIKNKSRPETPPEINYDDRPIPTAKKEDEPEPEPAQEEPPDGNASGEPETMNGQDMRDAGQAIEVFELPLVSKTYSKGWSFREEGLQEMLEIMKALDVTRPKDEAKVMMRAATFILVRSLKDKVFSVFTTATAVLRYTLTEFVPKHRIPKSDVAYTAERTLQPLIQKIGDTAVRNRESAKQFIVEESKFPEVKPLHVVTTECVKPFRVNIAPRLGLSRTELVELLYHEHGLQNSTSSKLTKKVKQSTLSPRSKLIEEFSGLTLDSMMKFCTLALQHNSGEIREKSEKIIISLYKECGAPVKTYLPPDDDKTRKNVLYKQLFEAFDRIDGKPSKDELKKQRVEEEQAKAKEIEALQAQLQALKDMAAGKAGSNSSRKPVDEAVINETAPSPKKKRAPITKKKKEKTPEPPEEDSTMFTMEKNLTEDSTCIFCGERDASFNEEGLDLHYWKNCPMLKRCTYCKQVVEISGFSEHLLTECESNGNFSKCPQCTEAILNPEHEQHVQEKSCAPAEEGLSHCPLCHINFEPGEDAWKNHLMGKEGCKANPRRITSLNRSQSNTGAKAKSKIPSKGKATPAKKK